MLGVSACIEDHHLVQAHTRLLTGGGEAFVAEHLRKNRTGGGRKGSDPRPRVAEIPSRDQPNLFATERREVVFEAREPTESNPHTQLRLL